MNQVLRGSDPGERPPRRRNIIHGEEEFEPRPMVPWFHPFEIARTALRAMLAHVVTTYADSRISMTGTPGAPFPLVGRLGLTASTGDREVMALRRQPARGSGPTQDLIDLRDSKKKKKKEEIWFDYVADTGDGFDSTYAMASILGRSELSVEGLKRTLPRGELLVLGGDMVYPWPSRTLYRDRFQVPFRWAFPGPKIGKNGGNGGSTRASSRTRGRVRPDPEDPLGSLKRAVEEMESRGRHAPSDDKEDTDSDRAPRDPPLMVALPGNHDWYDGLGNFLNVFCDGRRLGGWQTVQRRSYFAVLLPHGWTIWGNDAQLDDFTDRNQRAYFRALALDRNCGDKVILCTASPAWLKEWGESRRNMRFFEEEVLRFPSPDDDRVELPEGPQLPVVLSGDLHFYARYRKELISRDGTGDGQESEEKGEGDSTPKIPERHRIVCGGGGAYRRGTQDLPRELQLFEREQRGRKHHARRPQGGDPPDAFERKRNRYVLTGPCYPDRVLSRRLALGALRFPLRRHNLPYCLAAGVLFAAMAGLAQWSSLLAPLSEDMLTFIRRIAGPPEPLSPLDVTTTLLTYFKDLVFYQPAAAILPLLTVVVFMAFFLGSNPGRPRWTKWVIGLTWVLSTGVLFHWVLILVAIRVDGTWFVLGLHALISGFVCGLLTGFFLWTVNRLWGWNNNEVFSCQGIPHYNSFLRCHIDTDGKLTIYPIGVERVPRRWRKNQPRSEEEEEDRPVLVPVEQALRAHLIEPEIVVKAEPPEPGKGVTA